MMILALVKGLAIGFLLAVPVGPIGILCIRRTLAEGRRSAISTMLGAATADMVYGAVAVFGVTLVSSFVTEYFSPIRTIGGLILVYLGIRTFRAHLTNGSSELSMNHHAGNFLSTFLLTLTNPLTLFAFAAVIAGVGTIEETSSTVPAVSLVAGVFLGSMLWFSCLVSTTYFFRDMLKQRGLDMINRIAGGLIVAAGAYAIVSSFLHSS
jgi:threonine/homoserine/homoserine lactone efflux protein